MGLFKQYLDYQKLIESLYLVRDTEINFSKETQKDPSDKERISTFVPILGHKKDIDLNGTTIKVINLYNYLTVEVPQGILKSLKGKGPYMISDVSYKSFLNFTVDRPNYPKLSFYTKE